MKKIVLILLAMLLFMPNVHASNLVERENYLKDSLIVVGLPDFPPFAWYDEQNRFYSAFLQPTIEFMKKQQVEIVPAKQSRKDMHDLQTTLIDTRSGLYNLFIGANSDTKLYKGLMMIYPASVSNPIHLITYRDAKIHNQIHNINDLQKLRGVVSRSEYFSDFVLRKFKELNVEFVADSLEAYRKIITSEADYMMGSLYFNRIEAAKYGLETYLTYSKKPLYKIPIFIAISKETPLLSQYLNAFKIEFSNPDYSLAVKKEIVRIINEETEKYVGVVPPSFALREENEVVPESTTEVETPEFTVDATDNESDDEMNAIIIEHNAQQKNSEEVMDEIINEI